MQQDTEARPEGEKNPQPLEGMIEGGQLKEDKEELQKIIDRNKGQVQEDQISNIKDQDEILKMQNETEEKTTEAVPEKDAELKIPKQEVEQEAKKEEAVEAKEAENVQAPAKEAPQPVESFNQEVEIPEISAEKRREILEGLEGKIEKTTPTSAKDDSAKDDDQQQEVAKHAKEIVEISDPDQQIEKIVQLAISKDPYHAIRVAQHLDSNYILDKVHDELVEDKVRRELIKKGLLEEI